MDPSVLEREKSIFTEQAKESGKPDNIINKMVEGIAALNDYKVSSKNLGRIRHNHLKDIPTGTWGEITDRFLAPEGEYHADTNGWGLLNSATDILWHKEKPTLASYNHNAIITDGLINAVS